MSVQQRTNKNTTQHLTPQKKSYALALLPTANAQVIHLRDGEVVLYRRSRSLLYQCRYKLADGTWYRQSTRKASIEHAVAVACDLYDEARYRQRLGLAHQTHTFAQIAAVALVELRVKIDASTGRTAYSDYVGCIEKYFLPYFKDKRLEELTHTDIVEFEMWRDRQMRRKPKASTLMNFASAWNKLLAVAVERGYISERVPVPKLTTKGEKGKTRPAFSEEEINTLLTFMETWQHKGLRHGTEAMGICWRHLEWHTDKGTRYLRVWVDGKTGGRWLIARHEAVAVLKRLHLRQADIQHWEFEDLFQQRLGQKLFRIHNGYQPVSLNGTFRRLLRDAGLLVDGAGKTRTLYSLRHTYATQALLANRTDIHTLARQMGNSAAMIERHYSKLMATMTADRLA